MANTIFGDGAILQIKKDDIWKTFGCSISHAIQFENELIGKTDVNAGSFRKKRVRISDVSASVQGLTILTSDATNYNPLSLMQEDARSEQEIRLLLTDDAGTSKQISGMWVVKSVQITGNAEDFCEFDAEFEGTGGISVTDPDEGGDEIPGDIQFDWWEMAEGDTSITGAGHFGRSFSGEDILMVSREGLQYNETAGTPTTREYANSGTVISFVSDTPAVSGERVYVLWKNV